MKDKINEIKLDAKLNIYIGIVAVLGSIPFCGFCSLGIIKAADMVTRIVMIPFFVCSIAVFFKSFTILLQGINMLKTLNKIENEEDFEIDEAQKKYKNIKKAGILTNNLYLIGFFIFWFGFLIFFDYLAIKDWDNGGSRMFFFSLIFWVVGIYVIKSNKKRKKRRSL